MVKTETVELLKVLIAEILKKMGFENFTLGTRTDTSLEGENLIFNVGTNEADILIGQQGANLRALQHILRAIARRKTEDRLRFSLDINDYCKEKAESLADLANSMARQALEEKRSVVLRPMSAYERRIIHLTLSENKDIKTESLGEGEERKVVIKPVGNIESGEVFSAD